MIVRARLLLVGLVAFIAVSCAPNRETGPISRPPQGAGGEISGDHPYVKTLRAKITRYWLYPCVKDPAPRECEYKEADVTVEVGVHPNGHLASVHVVKSSGYAVYDNSAVNAVNLASPFDAVPDDLEALGFPARIKMRFNYVVDRTRGDRRLDGDGLRLR